MESWMKAKDLEKYHSDYFIFLFFINLMQLQWNDWHFAEYTFKYLFFVHCKPSFSYLLALLQQTFCQLIQKNDNYI